MLSLGGSHHLAVIRLSSSGCCHLAVFGFRPLLSTHRSSSSGRHRQAIFIVIRPVRSFSGCRCLAVVVRPSSSGCRCLAIVGRPSLSGHLCQVVVIRPVKPPSGLRRQAVVFRPSLSGRRRQAIVVRPLLSGLTY